MLREKIYNLPNLLTVNDVENTIRKARKKKRSNFIDQKNDQ